jgi:hypothetical protein
VTAAEFPGLPLPASDPEPGSPHRPRNFLSTRDYRRLFWAFMPPAVIAVIAIELFTRSAGEPGPQPEPQVDTRLEVVAGPPPAADEVVILPDDEPPRLAARSFRPRPRRSAASATRPSFVRPTRMPGWRVC